MRLSYRLWLSRVLVGIVFFFNVQSSLAFLIWPWAYTPGFELTGAVGAALIQGFGLLFLMWNVPYAFALWHPRKNRVSLYEAVLMQAIGFFGETILVSLLPAGHALLRASITRFRWFDGLGLALLLMAAFAALERRPQAGPVRTDSTGI